MSGRSVPLLKPETLPRIDFLSLADHRSCCCCEPGKKSEVRDVLEPRQPQCDCRGVRCHVGTCTKGSWAGLEAAFLGTRKITNSNGVSWPLVLSRECFIPGRCWGPPSLELQCWGRMKSRSSSQRMGLALLPLPPNATRGNRGRV